MREEGTGGTTRAGLGVLRITFQVLPHVRDLGHKERASDLRSETGPI